MNDLNINALEDSLENIRQHSNLAGQLHLLIQLGQAYQSKRRYQKALIYSKEALDLVKGQSNLDHKIVALVNTGCIFWEMSQLKKAMGLFQDALPIAIELGDDDGIQHTLAFIISKFLSNRQSFLKETHSFF